MAKLSNSRFFKDFRFFGNPEYTFYIFHILKICLFFFIGQKLNIKLTSCKTIFLKITYETKTNKKLGIRKSFVSQNVNNEDFIILLLPRLIFITLSKQILTHKIRNTEGMCLNLKHKTIKLVF